METFTRKDEKQLQKGKGLYCIGQEEDGSTDSADFHRFNKHRLGSIRFGVCEVLLTPT
jgi:hypothetical protein